MPRLRGVTNKAKAEFVKAMNGRWGRPNSDAVCMSMPDCRDWDYCPNSGCGSCDMETNRCTPFNPNNRDRGGARNICPTTEGCQVR